MTTFTTTPSQGLLKGVTTLDEVFRVAKKMDED